MYQSVPKVGQIFVAHASWKIAGLSERTLTKKSYNLVFLDQWPKVTRLGKGNYDPADPISREDVIKQISNGRSSKPSLTEKVRDLNLNLIDRHFIITHAENHYVDHVPDMRGEMLNLKTRPSFQAIACNQSGDIRGANLVAVFDLDNINDDRVSKATMQHLGSAGSRPLIFGDLQK